VKDFAQYNLIRNNTFGIEAFCGRFVEIESVSEAQGFLPTIASQPYLIIGGGSNLLLTRDYQGTVLRSAIRGIRAQDLGDKVLVRCGSGENWDEVVAYCVEHGYYGLENLSLIPGDVGASAVQNIGAYGMEAKDFITRVEAVEISTGKNVCFDNADCQYNYRQSRFKNEWKNKYFITHVTYLLSKVFTPHLDYGNIRQALADAGIESPTASDVRKVIIEIRQAKLPDPKVLGNAGSFFMNPMVPRKHYYEYLAACYPNIPGYDVDGGQVKIPAGWMIEQCGWKGRSLGRAGVYEKQALVLVNLGGATGNDIVTLCETIRKDVKEKFGIDIHPEVNII